MIAQLIGTFDEDAKDWGWQQDQGSGGSVGRSERDYNASKEALLSHAIDIEATLAMIEMHEGK